MPELVERGHVYIAVPPLYRVKIGNQEHYVEKESQFEELLVRERVKDIDVTDRGGRDVKLTEARWGRFARALNEFEGWSAGCARTSATPPADFVVRTGSSRRGRRRLGGRRARRSARSTRTATSSSVVGRRRTAFEVKVVERETSAATHVDVPAELLASPVYASLRRAYAKLADIVGAPPFTLALGKKTRARRDVRGAPPRGARPRQGGHPGQPLQGPRRDERRRALGDDDGSGEADAHPRRGRGRRGAPTRSSRC